jgi:thiamine kinase
MTLEDRIRTLAANALGIAPDAIRSVERIVHGLTNDNWIARGPQRSVVVRLNSPKAPELGVDRRNEARALQVAMHAGVGPRVLQYDLEEDVLITELLPGTPWSIEYARSSAGIARLAQLLVEVHALPIYDGIKRVDALSVIDGYWNTLEAAGRIALAGSLEQRATARVLGERLRRDVRPRLCHNDVHHLNLMDDGRVRLLDWEYAGLGDPYFDMAGVCCYHDFDDAQCAALLQHYAGRLHEAALERLNAARWLFEYIRELWTAVNGLQSLARGGGSVSGELHSREISDPNYSRAGATPAQK